MIYTEYDYETLAHLPEDANCIVESSHSARRDKEKIYLGGTVGTTINPTVNMELFTKTDEQAQEFYEWYVVTISGGTKPFSAFHEIFGRKKYYVLQIIDGIEEKIISGDNRKIKFSAEIIGITSPAYTLIEPAQVISDGTISIGLTPAGCNNTYNPLNFEVNINGTLYPVTSAIRENDTLLVSADYLISGGFDVALNHNTAEHGLGIFFQVLENFSAVPMATPTGTATVDSSGEYITIELDRAVANYSWSSSENAFSVLSDGTEISISSTINSVASTVNIDNVPTGQMVVYIALSRLIYSGEEITVKFNIENNIEIMAFSYMSIDNNSNVPDPNPIDILSGAIAENGLTTVCVMSAPQDIIYDETKTTLTLNGVSYPVNDVVQSAGSLVIGNVPKITTYVTSASLVHSAEEYGWGTENFTLTNNSTVVRATPVSAEVSQDGRTIIIITPATSFQNAGYYTENDDIKITVDGVETPIFDFDFVTNELHVTMPITRPVYNGEVVLVSFEDTADIEMSPFTDFSATNNSLINEGNRIISATVSTNGLSIVCSMAESREVTYLASDFNINHGYLDVECEEVIQDGTTMTLAALSPLRDNVTVTIDRLITSADLPLFTGQSTVNNSTVNAPEIVSATVVASGLFLYIVMDEILRSHHWGMTDFYIEVDGEERVLLSTPYIMTGTGMIILYIEGTIFDDDVVTVSFSGNDDPQIYPFTTYSVTNNSTAIEGVEPAPIYLMVEPLESWGGYYWLHNSAVGATIHSGKLCRADGTAMTADEVIMRYPRDATIDLSGGYYINTGWVAPVDSAWSISGVYNVVMTHSYDIYIIDYGGIDSVDIYLGNQDNPIGATPNVSGILYTPPTDSWKIYETPPSVVIPTEITYVMDSFPSVTMPTEIIYVMDSFTTV